MTHGECAIASFAATILVACALGIVFMVALVIWLQPITIIPMGAALIFWLVTFLCLRHQKWVKKGG